MLTLQIVPILATYGKGYSGQCHVIIASYY